MDAVAQMARRARELAHTAEHHQRTIVCNPIEVESLQGAVDRLMAEPGFEQMPAPIVTANADVNEGAAYIACWPCLASRLSDAVVPDALY